MKYKFKVYDRVRLYRKDAYCTLDKGDDGIIADIIDNYAVLYVNKKPNGISWDCVHMSWLAHVKE